MKFGLQSASYPCLERMAYAHFDLANLPLFFTRLWPTRTSSHQHGFGRQGRQVTSTALADKDVKSPARLWPTRTSSHQHGFGHCRQGGKVTNTPMLMLPMPSSAESLQVANQIQKTLSMGAGIRLIMMRDLRHQPVRSVMTAAHCSPPAHESYFRSKSKPPPVLLVPGKQEIVQNRVLRRAH